tara:strand:+ start:741 stop:920 length:180 start_codon:yes stop_codon:yes gene_type:complete
MVAGVDPTGRTDETSVQGTISWQVVISNRRVLMLLIVLAGSMIGLAPDQMAALLRLIGV